MTFNPDSVVGFGRVSRVNDNYFVSVMAPKQTENITIYRDYHPELISNVNCFEPTGGHRARDRFENLEPNCAVPRRSRRGTQSPLGW